MDVKEEQPARSVHAIQSLRRGSELWVLPGLWFVATAGCGVVGWWATLVASIPAFLAIGLALSPLVIASDRFPGALQLRDIVLTGGTGLIAGAVGGAILAVGQALILSEKMVRPRSWIIATASGGAIGGAIYAILSLGPFPADPVAAVAADRSVAIGGFVGSLVGTIFQWGVLRHAFKRAGWWAPASGASWACAWFIAYRLHVQLRPPPQTDWGAWLIVWPVGACLTAIALVMLLWTHETQTDKGAATSR